MVPFTSLSAVAVPLDQPNIDTDQIIPARYLGRPRAAQVDAMFHDLRFNPDGSSRGEFILNKPAFAGAKIVVAARNFGCGSSRENAVTVMLDNGFRAFIAPSFGDIFFNNCLQNGALPVKLDEARVAAIRQMLHQSPSRTISIDLATQSVTGPDGQTDRFDIDPFRKDCLLKGVDDVDLTLTYRNEIERFEAAQRQELPWL
ncbi:3-isopropylmalate dehydratase small subunit [Bradyrhizobium sp. LHD-71]|uniref:3-isopropylmalate dehydratase small subunit n=1 Tax=Bradyrhizobium sp. LHD-71 TaxID=3072141 RepID=UPI00280FC724|nr:3-isopropylmalate dehydratase small subunit [Bradyrhizobium sp. LHD-71]MDQ8728479.1 3-isopropylmalate dehydratase small subunit [Bradyrhizobium sp. LHD-71]